MSCLLCAGLLPKEEEEVVEQHMKDHHRVFTNMTLVVASSKLEATQLAGFEEAEAMRLFSRPRGTPADLSLTALPPLKAARLFLRRFELLSGQRIGKNTRTWSH